MATPTIVEVKHNGVSGNDASVTTTSGTTQAGDYLLVFHSSNFFAANQIPAATVSDGTTLSIIDSADLGSNNVHIWARGGFVSTGGAKTITAADFNGEEIFVAVFVLRGVNTTTPVDAHSSKTETGTNRPTTPSVTTTATDSLLFAYLSPSTFSTFENYPTGMTGQFSVHEPVQGTNSSVATLALSSSGATGTKTWEFSSNKDWAEISVAIKGASATSVSGTAAANLGSLTGTAVGKRTVNGTAASTLGSLNATATGTVTVSGSASISLGSLSATATGSPILYGEAASTLGALTATASGGRTVMGSAVSNLGGLNAEMNTQTFKLGVLHAPLGGLTATATGIRTSFGRAHSVLDALTTTSDGQKYVIGSAGSSLGQLVAVAVSFRTINGIASAVLGALTSTITGGGQMADLITVQDIVDAMGRDPFNEEEQAAWAHYIKIVSNYINAKVRYGFQSTTVTATYQADSYGQVFLRQPVTNIAYVRNFRSDNDDLWVDFDGVSKLFFLEPHQVIKVQYTYGYAEVPADIQDLAVSLVLAQIHETTIPGLRKYKIGDVEEGYDSGTQVARILDDMTKDVLDNYRTSWYTIPLTLDIFPDYQPQGFEEDFD